MMVTVNGVPRSTAPGMTLASLVATLPMGAGGGIAVAVNGAVVTRSSWQQTPLREGDHVEIVTATQGG